MIEATIYMKSGNQIELEFENLKWETTEGNTLVSLNWEMTEEMQNRIVFLKLEEIESIIVRDGKSKTE